MRHPPTLPQDLMAHIWSNSEKIADYLWKPSYGPLPLLGLSYPLHHISKACLNLQEFRGLQTVKEKEYLHKVVFGSRASSRAIGGGASCLGFHRPITATSTCSSTCTSPFLLLTSPCWRCHFLLLLPNPLLLLLLLYINQKQLASLPVCLSALTPEVDQKLVQTTTQKTFQKSQSLTNQTWVCRVYDGDVYGKMAILSSMSVLWFYGWESWEEFDTLLLLPWWWWWWVQGCILGKENGKA